MRDHLIKKTVILTFITLLLMGCNYNRPDYDELAERMADLDTQGMTEVDQERMAQLKSDIKRVDREINETIEGLRDRGTYYKLIGLKFMDYKMWPQGIEAFDQALNIYPDNSRLHYYRAVCLGQTGINESQQTLSQDLLRRAERDYLRAAELDRIYTSPLWGLAILYIYEMDRGSEAGVILDRLLKIEPSNERAIFLRAELYQAQGDRLRAIELYHKLEVDGKDKDIKEEAMSRAASLGG